MNNAIITGGTGMIGHALICYLISQNIKVTVLVRNNSEKISSIPKEGRVRVVVCGLEELSQAEKLLNESYDAFFHLGWVGTFGDARNNMYLQNLNIRYTLDAVALAEKLGCKVFVGAGSQAEYGRVEDEKLNAHTPTFPETGYGIAKLCAGQMSRRMAEELGIRHIWFRILSIFGPYDGDKTMVMSSIRNFTQGKVPEYTAGEQMWDYLYCDDAARALYMAAEQGTDGAVYCLGSGSVRPLREYIEIIRDITAPGLPISFGKIPYNEKQVMYLCADISDLSKDTGFSPKYTFEEGIRETVNWYKENRTNEENQYTNPLL